MVFEYRKNGVLNLNCRFALVAMLIAVSMSVAAQVSTGIESLRNNGFAQLQGKRIGLITNPTGVDSQLNSTADILASAPGVEIVAFFAPEHGIRGDIAAGNKVSNAVDSRTGIKVHSLYGKTRKPTAAMLAGIDALVYDIQDNGCRSYTFISTMGKAMEAAAENGIEFIVLDRPNPLGGLRVEGLITEDDCVAVGSQFPIQYRYVMTAGELAMFLKGERLIAGAENLTLTVVEMDGWERDMTFGDTLLPWVPTSPNIPTAETCFFYPATGIVGELNFLSIGIGFTLPFKTFAAPWIDGVELAERLNKRNIAGFRFRPISYKPTAATFSGSNVGGVEVFLTNPSEAVLTLLQFYVLEELHKMYPEREPFAATEGNTQRLRMFDLVTGSKSVRSEFKKSGYRTESIVPLWNSDVESFKIQRQKYLIY